MSETENKKFFPQVIVPDQVDLVRGKEWLLKHKTLLLEKWFPTLLQAGLSQPQAMRLWCKWFPPLGSVYKETKIEPGVFDCTMDTFMSRVPEHLSLLRFYLGELKGGSVSWDEVIAAAETAMPPDMMFFMQSGDVFTVTEGDEPLATQQGDVVNTILYDVYLPNVLNDMQARLRLPFSCREAAQEGHPVLEVTNDVTQETRYKVQEVVAA